MKHKFAVACAATLIALTTGGHAAEINVDDITVQGFTLSGLKLDPTIPYLAGIITGPSGMTANVTVLVTYFEKPDSQFPYARSTAGCAISPDQPRGRCELNNGPQNPKVAMPAKIEVQAIATTPTISGYISVPITLQN